jgi:4-diphosphocytidyl-2-C-methyl-D-erythritol kinase
VSYPAVLANPGVKLATKDVFAILNAPPLSGQSAGAPDLPRPGELRAYILRSRNDLEPPARRLSLAIGEVLGALTAGAGCWLSRLSGSGATCFGLYETDGQAGAAADSLRLAHPEWLVVATAIG